jgi:hypothetical protein
VRLKYVNTFYYCPVKEYDEEFKNEDNKECVRLIDLNDNMTNEEEIAINKANDEHEEHSVNKDTADIEIKDPKDNAIENQFRSEQEDKHDD